MPFKIRTKLVIAFLAIIFPFITIFGVIALYNSNTIRKASLKAEAISEELHLVLSFQLAIDKSLMPGNDYIITGNKKYIDDFKDASRDVEVLMKKLEETLVVLKGMDTPKSTEEMEILKSVRIAWQNIKEDSQRIFEIQNPVGNKEAARLMEEMDYKWAYPVIKMLDKHHEIDRKEHAEAIEKLQKAWMMAWVIMIGGAVFLITFGIFFALFFSRIFVLPIKQVHNGADAIAKGDFKVRLDIKTGDEIEQLSKAMNEMAKQLDTLYLNMEVKIEEGIERFRAITESANDAIVCEKSPGVIFVWNNKAEKMFGYKADEVLGKSLHQFIVPLKYREKTEEGLRNFYKTGQGPIIGKVVEVSGLRKDGTEFPVELSVSAIRVGEEWQAVGIIRDITERKKAEETIKKERDYSKNLVDTANAIILTLDTDGRIVSFNRYMEELSGYKLDEVKGKEWFTTFLPERDHERIRSLFKKAISGIQTKGNVNPIVTKNGRELGIEWYDSTIKDPDGRIIGLLAVGQDITERKLAEEKINEQLDYLERFRKATVQREFRIKELKDENEDLKRRLGIHKV